MNASADVARWVEHYWLKLELPREEVGRLAVTDDRKEFALWTGRRLNPMALGCYCYLPNALTGASSGASGEPPALHNAESATLTARTPRQQAILPGFANEADDAADHSLGNRSGHRAGKRPHGDYRHLIFIEPGLLPLSVEVTVAHELIHLADRVRGHPRKHRCHGYDSISMDEAAITGHDPEFLRAQLREETTRREMALRRVRPYRYVYVCPVCTREYPRVRRYTRPVSCGRCDRQYNAAFLLELRELAPGAIWIGGLADRRESSDAPDTDATTSPEDETQRATGDGWH